MAEKIAFEDLEQRILKLESEAERYAVQKNDDTYRILFKKFNEIVSHDISRRKQAENARQKEKKTFAIILESIPHGIAMIDNGGQYLYINSYFTKITGYTLKDIPTKEDWFKKAYPDRVYRKKVSQAWDTDCKYAGVGKYREFKIRCKNGEFKHIEFSSTFLKGLKISVLTDVTVRKQSQEMVREKDRLQGVLELSGAVCHEMNQPLMSIQGYFDLILMDISEDNPLYSRIEKIQVQIDRLSNTTKKLMEISRYETKDYLKERIVDLAKASTTEKL
jgi:PAS domain S-box-containing protein